jgi:hypothetical protein
MKKPGIPTTDDTVGDGQSKTTLKRAGIIAAAVLMLALGAGGGYLLGHGSGPDLTAARADGAATGLTEGKSTAGDAYAQGEYTGHRITFGPAYRDAYRKAYREVYEKDGRDSPQVRRISVPIR